MGNESSIFKLGESVNIDQMYGYLQEINNDIFGGIVPIKKHENSISFISDDGYGFIWWYSDNPYMELYKCDPQTDLCDEKEVSEDYFDFKDCPTPYYLMWIQDIFNKELIKRYGFSMFVDCLREYSNETDYLKTYKEYNSRMYNPFGNKGIKKFVLNRIERANYKRDKKIAKDHLPPDLYKWVFEK